jgi:hypothetical protein
LVVIAWEFGGEDFSAYDLSFSFILQRSKSVGFGKSWKGKKVISKIYGSKQSVSWV